MRAGFGCAHLGDAWPTAPGLLMKAQWHLGDIGCDFVPET